MSQEADLQAPLKTGGKPAKILQHNRMPQIDCWAVINTPLDFSFMKLATPLGIT